MSVIKHQQCSCQVLRSFIFAVGWQQLSSGGGVSTAASEPTGFTGNASIIRTRKLPTFERKMALSSWRFIPALVREAVSVSLPIPPSDVAGRSRDERITSRSAACVYGNRQRRELQPIPATIGNTEIVCLPSIVHYIL